MLGPVICRGLVFFILMLVCAEYACSIENSVSNTCIDSTQQIKVALMGDSLMSQAYFDFNLADQIMSELRSRNNMISYNISFRCFAIGGSAIVDIRRGQLWPVIEYQPNCTILFWDTDVSGVDEPSMKPEESDSLRATFRTNVEVVTETILNHTHSLMALAGPGVLGDDQVIKMAR